MISPNRQEIMWFALAMAWFLVGPLWIWLTMEIGLWERARFWLALIYVGGYAGLGGVGLALYSRRVAREMGAPGLVVTAIWIVLAILLARALMSAFRSAGP